MIYPFQTHLINCFVFIDCENGDIGNTETISDFLNKKKSKYLKKETKILCFFGKNKSLDSWKNGVAEKISDLSNFEFIATNENADMIISAYFGLLYKDFPNAEFVIISNDSDYSPLVKYFSGLKISISQEKIPKQKSKKQDSKSAKQSKNPAKQKTSTEKETEKKKGKQLFDLKEAKRRLLQVPKTKRPENREEMQKYISKRFTCTDLNFDTDELLENLKSDKKIKVAGEKIEWLK